MRRAATAKSLAFQPREALPQLLAWAVLSEGLFLQRRTIRYSLRFASRAYSRLRGDES